MGNLWFGRVYVTRGFAPVLAGLTPTESQFAVDSVASRLLIWATADLFLLLAVMACDSLELRFVGKQTPAMAAYAIQLFLHITPNTPRLK